MSIRLLLFFLCSFPLIVFSQINQTDSNGLRQGLWKKKQADGKPMYEGSFKNGKPVGEWKRYHEGGQVKAIIKYKGDTAQTQLFDLWRKKVAEGNYIHQKKEGTWKYYNENRIVLEEQFHNGEKDGVSKKYYETGEIMEETEWKNGKKEGKYQVFYKNGEPYFQCKMSDDQRNGLCITYFTNGRQELIAGYKNSLRHGEWKFHNEQGKHLYTLIYNEGILQNPEVRDSISNIKMLQMEKNKSSLTDPEEFLNNPLDFLIKKNINR